MKEMKLMRELRHDNVNSFIGACVEMSGMIRFNYIFLSPISYRNKSIVHKLMSEDVLNPPLLER